MSKPINSSAGSKSLSFPISIDTLSNVQKEYEVAIDHGEGLKEIAVRIGVPSVKSASGHFTLRASGSGEIELQGSISAELERICVASLEHMDESIVDTFTITFSPGDLMDQDEIDVEMATIEPLISDTLDLGEILIQHLALAMAPYPRKYDQSVLAASHGEYEEISPFSGLASLLGSEKPEK